MTKVIRVVVTSVYTYTPDFSSFEYSEEGVTTVEQALAWDKKAIEAGDFSVDEFTERDPIVTYDWSIIDE